MEDLQFGTCGIWATSWLRAGQSELSCTCSAQRGYQGLLLAEQVESSWSRMWETRGSECPGSSVGPTASSECPHGHGFHLLEGLWRLETCSLLLLTVTPVSPSGFQPWTLQPMGWSTLPPTSLAFLRIARQFGQLSAQYSTGDVSRPSSRSFQRLTPYPGFLALRPCHSSLWSVLEQELSSC